MGTCCTKSNNVVPAAGSPPPKSRATGADSAAAAGRGSEARSPAPVPGGRSAALSLGGRAAAGSGAEATVGGSMISMDESTGALDGSRAMRDQYRSARTSKHFRGSSTAAGAGAGASSESHLSPAQRARITECIRSNPVFQDISESLLEGIFDEMVPLAVTEGQVLFREGDESELFYVVDAGEVELLRGGKPLRRLGPGQAVGEDALRLKSNRLYEARLVTDGCVLALGRVIYQRLIVKLGSSQLNAGVSTLRAVPILAPLTDEQLVTVAGALQEVEYPRGHKVITQGEVGDAFYIIKEGTVSCRFEGSQDEVRRLGPGDFFGEGALLTHSPRSLSVIAASRRLVCLRMGAAEFTELLGSLHELLDHNFNKRVLSSVPLFKKLTQSEQDEIAEHMEARTYADGEYIIRQGEEAVAFYVVKEGTVKVTRTDPANPEAGEVELGVMVAGDFFGEGGFLTGEPRNANCIAVGATACAVLNRAAFTEILGSIEDVLAQNFTERVKNWEPGRERVHMEDLVPVRRLGAGNFGRVDIVRHRVTGKTYALKQILKRKVETMELQSYVEYERGILADLNCPFIVRLHGTFRTRRSVYLLMDYILGGEVSRLLDSSRSIPVPHVRFYTANVVLALKYLHDQNVLHRDLKPQNIMIDKSGYLKLVDFGLAKRLKPGGRTFTICGTPDYVAPEVLRIGSAQGYGAAADWWAFGILVFRMVAGFHPFGLTCSSDLSEVWSILCEYANRYPNFEFGLPSKDLTDLVRRLLHPNPAKRLGAQKTGARKLMKHAFFAAMDWSALAKMTVEPPFRPEAKSMLDTTNFEQEGKRPDVDALSVELTDDAGNAWYRNF